MSEVMLPKWQNNLSRITWFPITLLALVFFLTTALILHQEREKSWGYFEKGLAKYIKAQETGFADDAFLNQEEALKLRLESMVRTWRHTWPTVHACLKFVPVASAERAKSFSACTYESEKWEDGSQTYGETPILIGDKALAKLQYFVIRRTGWEDIFPPKLAIVLILASIAGWLLHRQLVKKVQENILNPLLERVARDERNAIIAETTQMLAHDVMSPLRATQNILDSLKRVSGDQEFRSKRDQFVAQVESTIINVRGMLGDILWLGGGAGPDIQELPVRPIIKETLGTAFLVHAHAYFFIRYDFMHKHMVIADPRKIRRVFANLIENGVQSMGGSGQLWFRTKEINKQGEKFIEFCIGNSGSYVPPDIMEKIFNRFYTTKKRGNGLGLTIAKTIVTDHGGDIRCVSSREQGTEFYFTLPMGSKADLEEIEMPVHSKQNQSEGSTVKPTESATNVVQFPQPEVPPSLAPNFGIDNVLLFDDDQLVHDLWDTRARNAQIRNLVHFQSWEDFIARDGHVQARDSVAFVDLNFKDSKFDGLDIARNLRSLGLRKVYAITGNASKANESKLFDAVFAKEMPVDIRNLLI